MIYNRFYSNIIRLGIVDGYWIYLRYYILYSISLILGTYLSFTISISDYIF